MYLSMIERLALVATLMLGFSLAYELFAAEYAKVPNTFLEFFGNCTLLTTPMQTETKVQKRGCMLQCSLTPHCSLACFNGASCLLSSALVTPYWVPTASSEQALLQLSGYTCYTTWLLENDVTTEIVSVSGTPINPTIPSGLVKPEYVTDGYYCNSRFSLYQANKEPNAWLQLDMGTLYSILKLVVKVRGTTSPAINFSNVTVSVGNVSGNGDYSSFSTLGTYVGSPSAGEIVTFEASTPIIGRYISLVDRFNESFTVSEIKVIGIKVY